MMIGPAPVSISPTPQDQRAHQALAEVCLGNQHRAQAVGGDRDGLDVGECLLVHEVRTARKLGELTHEVAALMDDDLPAMTSAGLSDFDPPRQDQHQPRPDLAGPRQHVAGLRCAAHQTWRAAQPSSVKRRNICAPRVA